MKKIKNKLTLIITILNLLWLFGLFLANTDYYTFGYIYDIFYDFNATMFYFYASIIVSIIAAIKSMVDLSNKKISRAMCYSIIILNIVSCLFWGMLMGMR